VSHETAPDQWFFLACIPDFPLETHMARNVLPNSYSRQDVVHALSHAALVSIAFHTADIELLAQACEDRLHEPYRKPLIDDFDIVEEACKEEGAKAVWISGSGPTIMAAFI